MRRTQVWVLAGVGAALAVVSSTVAVIRLGAPDDQRDSSGRPLQAATTGLLDDPDSFLPHLSAEERQAVGMATDGELRKLLIINFYLRDRLSGDPRELRPFLDALRNYRFSDPGDDGETAFERAARAYCALGFLARAWARVGPVTAVESECVEHAVRGLEDPDETVRLLSASLLTVIQMRRPDSVLPAGAQRALDEATKNDWLRFELGRQMDVLREAARAVGRDLPG